MDDFFQILDRIDRVIEQRSTNDFTSDVLPYLENIEVSIYFFESDKVKTEEWLDTINSAGLFNDPPDEEYDENTEITNFKIWMESRYLAKMSEILPEKVCNIILEIPKTNNSNIHNDYIEAALVMPVGYCKKITFKEIEWISTKKSFIVPSPYSYAKLIKYLAGEKEKTSLELANVLFKIFPDPNQTNLENRNDIYYRPSPRALFDYYIFNDLSEIVFKKLTEAFGLEAIDVFSKKLREYIKFSKRNRSDDYYEKHSYFWRPAIEDHAQNRIEHLDDYLVSTIRDMAEYRIELKNNEFIKVFTYFKNLKNQIFDRINFYLLNKYFHLNEKLGIETILDRNIFDDIAFLHEYAGLLDSHFDKLDTRQQDIFFGWINQGPKDSDENISEADKEKDKDHWRLRKLSLIKKYLHGDMLDEYNKLVEKNREPEHPDFAVYSSAGFKKPVHLEELNNKIPCELADTLKKLKIKNGFEEPSPRTLSDQIANEVRNSPDTFSKDAARCFIGLNEPNYIRGLIIGFEDAIKGTTEKEIKEFDWIAVLELCDWVTEQGKETKSRIVTDHQDRDPDWEWTRTQIARLIRTGFETKTFPIPIEQRERVWKIIEAISSDESEDQFDDDNRIMDFTIPSLNISYGVALHAAIRYALWVRKYYERQENSHELLKDGFEKIEEFKKLLEKSIKNISLRKKSTYIKRSVIGQWFPWLVLLDKKWAEENTHNIFPNDNILLWKSAWNAYILLCNPYDNVLKILKQHYKKAVEELPSTIKQDSPISYLVTRLIEHISVFYWRGKLDLEDELLNELWIKTPDEVRGNIISFIGRSLWNTEKAIENNVIERLKALWEKRIAAAKSHKNRQEYKDEMAAFGWWFVSKQFLSEGNTEWVLNQLRDSLAIAGKIEIDREVVKVLSKLDTEWIEIRLDILDLLAKSEKQRFGMHLYKDELLSIFEECVNQKNAVRQKAMKIINLFASEPVNTQYREELREVFEKIREQ